MARERRNIFFVLFTLSGFSGLIYESIWTHYLKLFLGHAAYAQTLVLAIFMGGMAIGSWLCSRYSGKWRNLLRGYAVTEGVIGICALVFHDIFARSIQLSYTAVIPWLAEPALITAYKWTLSAFLILPQSILLGMTFPLMSAGILRLFPERPGRSVAMLYFTNSIGAAVGVLTSGFLLIRLVGLPGTIRFAGLINIALAAVVWALSRGLGGTESVSGTVRDTAAEPRWSSHSVFLLLASLVTGTASFIYEIGWIRMLTLVLGSTTHAFELMLSAFIFGLAFGGLWLQRRIDLIARPVRFLALVQMIMGTLALSTLLLYGHTFDVMQWIVTGVAKTDAGYALFNLSSSAIALAIMLPTTFCAGMTLPLITLLLLKDGHGERSIGAVYGANTVGAIIGVFFAIHIGMPVFGLKGLISCGAGLDIGLGIALLWSRSAAFTNLRQPALLTALGVGSVAATMLFVQLDFYKMGSGVYRAGELLDRKTQKLDYYRDGKTASVTLVENKMGVRFIRTNGKTDAAVMMYEERLPAIDEPTMILLGVIPMALNPHAETAAAIGFGSGLTSHTMLSNPLIREVDTVEIERSMIEAAQYFRPRNELVYSDPRSHVYIDDAKTFFSTHQKKYDLIVSEPSNPWVSGVAGLFSGEFYGLIRRHMNDDGLFVQWVQLYETNVDLLASVLKAVAGNFSDYVVYACNDVDIMIIARQKGANSTPDLDILKSPAIAAALRRINIAGPQDIALRKVGNKESLGRLLQSFSIRANSDYHPVLDQNAGQARFLGTTAFELLDLVRLPFPTLEMLKGAVPPWQRTEITRSLDFEKSQAAVTAMALRDYFVSGSFNPRYGYIPESSKQDAVSVKELFSGCGSVSSQNARLGSLFITAINMIPYLTPSELADVWQALDAGPCAQTLSRPIRESVELFKAISRRDGPEMSAAARTLLENNPNLSPSTVRYAVAAGMTGNLMQGKKKDSLELWERYKQFMIGNDKPDLQFRLLVAESES